MRLILHGLTNAIGRQLRLRGGRSPYDETTSSLAVPTFRSLLSANIRRWAYLLIFLEIAYMLSQTVKRSLLSLLAVSTVATLGFSAAASLNVQDSQLGAGDAAVEACTDEVEVAWDSVYAPNPGSYVVQNVTISADDLEPCDGLFIEVTIAGELNAGLYATLATVFTTIDHAEDGDEVTMAVSPVVPAEDVYHVAVLVTSP